MATTITWKHTGYKHETAGKEYVSNVEWQCTGADGDATGSYNSTTVLDKPADSDMETRTDFATDAKIIAGVKAKLGATEVTRIEDEVKAQVAEAKAPTTKWAYPLS
tara:strand:+ start:191 stop:508 length:318 start_codon:yes stop_codon:yes gene_type:complete